MQLIGVLVGVPFLLALGCYPLGCSLLLCILLFIHSVYVDTGSIVSCLYAMILATHANPSALSSAGDKAKHTLLVKKRGAMMGNNKWKMYKPPENTPKNQKKTQKNIEKQQTNRAETAK